LDHKTKHKIPNPDKLEITNFKHHLILKLGQKIPNDDTQISNKIRRQLFGILNFGHCDLPFDLAQGGEVVSLSNHLVFVICYLEFLNC